MKYNIIYSLIITFMLTTIVGCKKDSAEPVLTKVEPSVIDYLPSNMLELQDPSITEVDEVFTITWTETLFYLDNSNTHSPVGPVDYTLQIDIVGNNFKNAQTISVTPKLFTNITASELNGILVSDLGGEPGNAQGFELRLIVKYGEGNNEINSENNLPLTITPYFPPKKIEPIYLVGNMELDSELGDKTYMMYRNSNQSDDYVYTYTGKFKDDASFNLVAESDLENDNVYYASVDGKLGYGEAGDYNFGDEIGDGYYTITIDLKSMSWSVEEFDSSTITEWNNVHLVGAFSDWGESGEPNMLSTPEDNHQYFLEIELSTIEYGVKFRAENTWDNKWCPIVPDDNPYGVSEFNPTEQDNNISLDEYGDGNYFVRLNAITGHYYIVKL